MTKKGGPDFVAPAERIATFDNDGTLWAEQPLYFQFLLALARVKALAPQHPEWKEKEPFASLLKGNEKAALAGGEKAIAEIVMATHAGITTAEFDTIVKEWLAAAKHPKFQRPYTSLVYQPMLELLAYLRANGFKTFIVSGGGVEFIRTFTEKVYGIPPGAGRRSTGQLKSEFRDGKPALLKFPAMDLVDDGPGKPVGIQQLNRPAPHLRLRQSGRGPPDAAVDGRRRGHAVHGPRLPHGRAAGVGVRPGVARGAP